MAAKTEAQEEFDSILSKASAPANLGSHPDDAADYRHDRENEDRDEEDEYRQSKIDESMRMPLFERSNGSGGGLRLPHREFDQGRTTGVKGVIADARSYEEAKRSSSWRDRISRRTGSIDKLRSVSNTRYKDLEDGSVSDDEEFLESWREARRQELQGAGNDIRNRRTSPSCRRYGRFDEVDALGYLDAIEKVGRETVVVVFVYDHECPVSTVISDALTPLVAANPTVHFVRVHYEDIEFDNAGVPAILAYKNQGDLFANLTYIIDQIPEDTEFDTKALRTILEKHNVLESRDG
ncbi:phosducin-like protein [Coleophoma cylindrospora]|uniref:Phosducin-like protein n=1 Tax=Coleophoma cylindrospora TaxID=1849047 RepID=A0A3D8SSN4_9HELO|nr:phosducin-like protein [Coleophoma cylindrospora]